MSATTTSLRLPDDVRDLYDTLVAATGRSRNDLMVEALRLVGERQLKELARVQEGQRQLRAGQGIPFEAVLNELRANGMLPHDEDEHTGGSTGADRALA